MDAKTADSSRSRLGSGVAAGGGEPSSGSSHLRSGVPRKWWVQIVIVALVLAYGISTYAVHRVHGYSTFWDGWIYTIAETLPAIPLWLRARNSPRLASAWRALAVGIVLNTAGDVVYTFHDQNLRPIPSPAPSDALYLASYVAFIVGVAMMTQSSYGRIHLSIRLDGVVAGLTLAALAGKLWFEPLLHASGRPLEIVVEMAYPVGDLVLLVLLVAGLAPQRYRPNWTTVVLMTGVWWFVVGDVIYLNKEAVNSYIGGTPLDETWLVGYCLLGIAAAMPLPHEVRTRGGALATPSGIATVPVICALVALGVIGSSFDHHESGVVLGLAIGALLLVIVRMGMTLREVRQSLVNFQDARTDSLTGLSNRRAFLESITGLINDPSEALIGVLLIDLDGFKEVNDALGHAAGDELLIEVASRLRQRSGGTGILARLGGDEFAYARIVSSEEEMVEIARDFSRGLVEPCILDGVSVRVGSSIGVATSATGANSGTELLRSADVAMYESKRKQSDVAIYRAAQDPNSRERLALLDDLRDAIENRAFTMYYQPTLDLRSNEVRGVEALVRWNHPTRGMLYPDSFIDLTERAGLMPRLTRCVLDQAVHQAALLNSGGRRLQMSVNISRYDLVDEDLPDYVDGLLERCELPRDRLTLEITESSLGSDPDRAARIVRELRSRGLRISIDDFGVGYSSMSQLLCLSIDELKIDKSFITGLEDDPRALAIVRSTIELARALDLTVVAEGIEREEVLISLEAIGTDVGQGFFIAHPLTPAQLEIYLAAKPVPVTR